MGRAQFVAQVGAALLAACSPAPPGDATAVANEPIISGTDDRLDIYQLDPLGAAKRNADGVALLAFGSGLVAHDGVVDVPTESYQLYNNACSSERYATQPVATNGYCTAYLVSPRLVVTAGHCLSYAPVGSDASEFRVVFGFEMLSANVARTTVAATEVYTTVSVAAVCDGGWDCSVLMLDRPVTNHTLLPIRRTGQPTLSDSVYVIGHPFLLPLKYDGTAPITGGVSSGIFLATTLDTAGGNSGSPVFNAATNVVEGTLSGSSGSGSLVPFDFTDAGCNVEHVATPADGYTATAQFTTLYASYIPAYCSGDTAGWPACGASGCGICASMLDTTKFDRYLANHPNCTRDLACTGTFAPCSEACPPPVAADSSGQAPDAGTGDAGADAGVGTIDAGEDTAADAGVDAGNDAAVADASADAAVADASSDAAVADASADVAVADASTAHDAGHDADASVAVLDSGPTDSARADEGPGPAIDAADAGNPGSPTDAEVGVLTDAGDVVSPIADARTNVSDDIEQPAADAGAVPDASTAIDADVNGDNEAIESSPMPDGTGCACNLTSRGTSTPGLAGVLIGLSVLLRRRRSR